VKEKNLNIQARQEKTENEIMKQWNNEYFKKHWKIQDQKYKMKNVDISLMMMFYFLILDNFNHHDQMKNQFSSLKDFSQNFFF
jgi:hypothetical protein